MSRKLTLLHHRKVLLIITSIMIFPLIIGLVIGLNLVNQSQELRKKASEACYIATRFYPTEELPAIMIGSGGKREIDGWTYCVGGAGEFYESFYETRDAGTQDLTTDHYPCQHTSATLDGLTYILAQDCQVDDKVGKIVCAGGLEREVWGCTNSEGGNHYRRLGWQDITSDESPTVTPTPTAIVEPSNTPTPTPISQNTCQCDLWSVVEDNCVLPSQAVCTNKFSCNCATPTSSPTPTLTSTPTPTSSPTPTLTSTPTPTLTLTPTPTQQPDDCHRADLNCDGKIDLTDYNLFLQEFKLF